MQKILVIQLARMGDLLQSSPLIQGIRKNGTNVSISLLTSEQTKEVARAIPGVDEVLGFDFGQAYQIVKESEVGLFLKYHRLSGLLNGLKGRFFDGVYNLNYSPINANLMNLIQYRKAFCYGLDRSKRKILKSPWLSYLFSILGDRRLNRFNLVDIYLQGAGISPPEPSLPYQIGEEARAFASHFLAQQGINHQDLMIGFQLGAGDAIRCWPIESYARLADLLTQRQDVRILLFGSSSERELKEEFQAHFNGLMGNSIARARIINLVGKTTLQELAAFLEHCDLLVTPDTGTMHLATAVGTRILALFLGSAFCHETAPYGNNHFILHPNLECYPCFQNKICTDYACKKLISPEAVANVIQWIWKQDRTGLPGTDSNFLDSRLSFLQSKIGPHFVEYFPVGKIPYSMEEILSMGYRAMWRGVLNDNWTYEAFEGEKILKNYDMASLSENEDREIRVLKGDFERLHRILTAGSGSFHADEARKGELTLKSDQLVGILREEEETGTRWIKPLVRFFNIEHANIQLSGMNCDIQSQRLLARVARGAEFMKAFLGKVLLN